MDEECSHFIEENKDLNQWHLASEPTLPTMAMPVSGPLQKMDEMDMIEQIDLLLLPTQMVRFHSFTAEYYSIAHMYHSFFYPLVY